MACNEVYHDYSVGHRMAIQSKALLVYTFILPVGLITSKMCLLPCDLLCLSLHQAIPYICKKYSQHQGCAVATCQHSINGL
jgi:hypothetical protein